MSEKSHLEVLESLYETPCDVMDKYDANKLKTKTIWSSEIKRWVCAFCGEQPNTFYVVTGHDHTDDSIWWCDCRREPK